MARDLRVRAWANHDGTFSVILMEYRMKRNRAGRLFHKHIGDIQIEGQFPYRVAAVGAAQEKRRYLRLQEETRVRLLKEARNG